MVRRLIIPGAAFLLFLALSTNVVVSHLRADADMQFTYALDDAYIHLALARNLVDHGVFGITPPEFSSASSSPLWVTVLGLLRLVGVSSDLVPLVLNVLAAALILLLVEWLLRKAGTTARWRLFVAIVVVLNVSFVDVAMTGMENLTYVAISLLYLGFASDVLARGNNPERARVVVVLSPLLTVLRYEGFFMVGIVAVLLLCQRRYALATAVASASTVLALAFGAYMVSHGASFLPNPLLLKPERPDSRSIGAVVDFLLRGPGVLMSHRDIRKLCFAVIGALLLSRLESRERAWTWVQFFGLVAVLTALAHATFAAFGCRYEAYLRAHLLVAFVGLLSHGGVLGWVDTSRARKLALVIAAAAGVVYLGDGITARVERELRRPTLAMDEIHGQQRQMARFLEEHYPGAPVALNDIGAVALYSSARVFDLVGLGSDDVMGARLDGSFDRDWIAREAVRRGVRVALVYNSWFADVGLPEGWIEVARWKLARKVAVGDTTVSFYATSEQEVSVLERALDAFESSLPALVTAQRLPQRVASVP